MYSIFGRVQTISFFVICQFRPLGSCTMRDIAKKAPASPIFPIRLEIGLRESFHSSPPDYSLPFPGGH